MKNKKPLKNTRLKQISAQIRAQEKRNIQGFITIGRLLTAAREQLEHGQWLSWLYSEFKWSYRTAKRYMSVYELSKQIRQFAQFDLSLTAIYLVADPETPKPVQQKILRLAAKERVSFRRAQEIMREHDAREHERDEPSPTDDASPADDASPPPPSDDPPAEDEGGDAPQDDTAAEEPPPLPPAAAELFAALRTVIENMAYSFAEPVVRAGLSQEGISTTDLIAVAGLIRTMAETLDTRDEVQRAADRAEARSRAQQSAT